MTETFPLVSVDYLYERLEAPDIRILDSTWALPGSGPDGKTRFLEERIPGAAFFDIDDIADAESPLPHMLPSAEKFASRMRAMGVSDGMRIIVYDASGIFAAARVWWTFRAMGHMDVAVLDGGLPAWKAAGLPLESGPAILPQPRHFTAQPKGDLVRSLDQMRAALAADAKILDARPAGRFQGRDPEPRPGLLSGHMPGARNLPHSDLLAPDGRMRSREELLAAFAKAGIDPRAESFIATCGSGVSAAILALGAAVLGRTNVAIYDGSWAEWGGRGDTPIAREQT